VLFGVDEIGKPKWKPAKRRLERESYIADIYNTHLNSQNALDSFRDYDSSPMDGQFPYALPGQRCAVLW